MASLTLRWIASVCCLSEYFKKLVEFCFYFCGGLTLIFMYSDSGYFI
jgi:hypothetical protein